MNSPNYAAPVDAPKGPLFLIGRSCGAPVMWSYARGAKRELSAA
jgi:hypothetical protein